MAQRGATDAGAEAHGEAGQTGADDLPRIPFAAAEITPDAREAAARVLASGWVTTGPEVVAFEREFADWVGAPDAVAVSSCTAAIELALRGLRLPPGSKVLTSVMTFCGAVHAITHAGHQPVFADVDPETLMPGPAETAAAAARAGGVDAMLVLHFAGAPAPVAELAAAAGLPLDRVVEDAAHAVGGWVGEQQVGTISAATCFSFYATKNLPIGEGGMLTTADSGLADWARTARLHGMSRDAWKRYLPGANWRYRVELDGLKANLTDVQAAIGRAHLRHLGAWQERRGELAERYDKQLAEVPGVAAPWRPVPEQGRHAWHLYVIRVGPEHGLGRDGLIAELARRGIDCSVHFIPLHHQPWFQERWAEALTGGFPVADTVFSEILSLPLYPRLADGDVDRVCEAIADLGTRSAGGGGMTQ
ncbi:MAG TPA: DegT/DnrJ/EryC1/StrS aminotransferase family protein [Actinomycetota bacterium]|jgi:dTDP-4-amino-4,6-dideoxygalactose transaminase|nr:DegT/DnrJ/EryC1/StrS aminotransferase family protein [Actinomycetota bacterium]